MKVEKHHPQRWKHRATAAFTMIEVLLAIAIFSFVMIAIYSAWSFIMRGSRRGLQAAAEVQRTRITMQALQQALGSAVIYAENAPYYAFFADTGGSHAWLSFVARLPESFPGSGLFQGQEVRRVEFSVGDDGTLLLRQMPLLEFREHDEQPFTIKLAPNVSLFAMEFFDIRKNDWVGEWPFTNQLPRLCRIALAYGKDSSGNPGNITLRTIQMGASVIARVGPGGGMRGMPPPRGVPLGQPGTLPGQPGVGGVGGPGIPPGGLPPGALPPGADIPPGEMGVPVMSIYLPPDFSNRRGIEPNPVFPAYR
jgi:type II secretion system protein J